MTGAAHRWRKPLIITSIIALVLFIVAALLVAGALGFAVVVNGNSMEPTLHTGDRLITDTFGKKDPKRFDLIQGKLSAYHIEVVKRVIGLPGDRISIQGGPRPVVYLQPSGSEQKYEVESSTWASQISGATQSCCNSNGTRLDPGVPAQTITVPPDEYWVIGDNWGGSDDSRTYGFIAKSDVQSTLDFRVLPLSKLGRVPNPAKLVAVPN
jgi:signal peptidase I